MDSSQEDTQSQEIKGIEMEPSVSLVAKKFWHMVRIVYFMLRKGISKGKLMFDLKLMIMKRNKLSGKSIHNLMFHHHHHHNHTSSTTTHNRRSNDKIQEFQYCPPPDEYEFSCSNSPMPSTFHFPFNLNKRKNPRKEDEFAVHAVIKALEMLNSGTGHDGASPALPGFGKSPMVRQLRITDSPFPLKEFDDEDSHVDEAAEEFIEKFYKDLRRQNAMAS